MRRSRRSSRAWGVTVGALTLAALIAAGGVTYRNRRELTETLVERLNRDARARCKNRECTQSELISYLKENLPSREDHSEYARYKRSILDSGNLGEYEELVRMRKTELSAISRQLVDTRFESITAGVKDVPKPIVDSNFQDQMALFPVIKFTGSKLRNLVKRIADYGLHRDKLNAALDAFRKKLYKKKGSYRILFLNSKNSRRVSSFLRLLMEHFERAEKLTDSQRKLYIRLLGLEGTDLVA